MTFADAKQRFSNRVTDYVRYRPSYPPALLDLLRAECDLRPDRSIADIGSGTGLLTKLFLDNGNRVFGVEPNEEMRAASERFLEAYKDFSSINGSAEATTLPSQLVDFITAGQAFHWFNVELAGREFRRCGAGALHVLQLHVLDISRWFAAYRREHHGQRVSRRGRERHFVYRPFQRPGGHDR